MRLRYSGWLAYQRSRSRTRGPSRSAIAKPTRMRSQRSSAGRARSTACEAWGPSTSCGFPIGGAAMTAAFGPAASGAVTAAGVVTAAGAVAAGKRAAVEAGGDAGAEPAGGAAAGEGRSSAADSGAESQGICEHAAASTHTAVDASSLPSFAVNGLRPFLRKSRDSSQACLAGQASSRFGKTFSTGMHRASRVHITHDRASGFIHRNWFFHWRSAAKTPAGSLTRLPRYLFADSMTAGVVTRRKGLVAFSRPIVEGNVGRRSRLA